MTLLILLTALGKAEALFLAHLAKSSACMLVIICSNTRCTSSMNREKIVFICMNDVRLSFSQSEDHIHHLEYNN